MRITTIQINLHIIIRSLRLRSINRASKAQAQAHQNYEEFKIFHHAIFTLICCKSNH